MELLHTKKPNKKSSSQKYVDVEEIKNGIILLKNKSLRAVLLVSSINFELKSTEEQDAIIAQYQNFLNSLDFPSQIVISSRRLNITPYLDMLKGKEKQQENELLRFQISEYRNFIKNLTEVSQIMSRFFYIVVPFYPVENDRGGFFSKLGAIFGSKERILERREAFETYANQLWQRTDQITAGLSGIGLKVTPLKTEELIELLYNSYNPDVFTNAIIKDVEKMELER